MIESRPDANLVSIDFSFPSDSPLLNLDSRCGEGTDWSRLCFLMDMTQHLDEIDRLRDFFPFSRMAKLGDELRGVLDLVAEPL